MTTRGIGAALAALTVALTSAPALGETLEERVERLDQEVRELKAELQRRDGSGHAHADRPIKHKYAESKERTQPKTATAPLPTPTAKPEPVATANGRPERAETPMPTTKVPFLDRVRIGGYGSMRYEVTDNPADKNSFELRRFVLAGDATIAPRLSAYFELEFERFRQLEVEKNLGPAEGGLSAAARDRGHQSFRDLARADLDAVRHPGLAQVSRRRRPRAARAIQHQPRRQPMGPSAAHPGGSRRAGPPGLRRPGTSSASASSATFRSPRRCCSTTRPTSCKARRSTSSSSRSRAADHRDPGSRRPRSSSSRRPAPSART